MTIEQLLGKSVEELEAMTDAQLQEYFGPYLQFTRPKEKQLQLGTAGKSMLKRTASIQRTATRKSEIDQLIAMAQAKLGDIKL